MNPARDTYRLRDMRGQWRGNNHFGAHKDGLSLITGCLVITVAMAMGVNIKEMMAMAGVLREEVSVLDVLVLSSLGILLEDVVGG